MGAPNVLVRLEESAVLAAGIEPMTIPEGGPHVRAAEIRVPVRFRERPTVTATVSARSGPGVVGTVFGIFNIKVNIEPDSTQVVIQATNVQKGVPVEGEFGCDYVIVGKVA